jgi:hypothetical protein
MMIDGGGAPFEVTTPLRMTASSELAIDSIVRQNRTKWNRCADCSVSPNNGILLLGVRFPR